MGRYGEPILFRHHNGCPPTSRRTTASGATPSRRTSTTATTARERRLHRRVLLPRPVLRLSLADRARRLHTINTGATDPRAGSPDDSGGINKVPGDWHETMSTHWFHDHMFSFTSQNVYKGNAAMFNIYSSLDRGNEAINDGVNLRLPAARQGLGQPGLRRQPDARRQGLRRDGQLYFDIFDFDGFLGDVMTVNLPTSRTSRWSGASTASAS
jgi:hypothetical protein